MATILLYEEICPECGHKGLVLSEDGEIFCPDCEKVVNVDKELARKIFKK